MENNKEIEESLKLEEEIEVGNDKEIEEEKWLRMGRTRRIGKKETQYQQYFLIGRIFQYTILSLDSHAIMGLDILTLV